MSFEKSHYTDPKENGSPIIFDFKDDNVKVSLNNNNRIDSVFILIFDNFV